ncbi:hypothetical protein WR25_00174 [Diploscapter pachys]|uniref:FERM domain-containing protein n=1 Tax=Diploscapter pachys TaxID=2018661 RepID=A0A2A2JL91_9BILA|nr:hypothetical protein WR25_00174 [Diploscapter pachys]
MVIELLRQLPTSSDFLFLDPPSFPTQIRASKQSNLHKWCNFNDSIASSIRRSAMESFRETGRFPESNLDYLIDSSGLEQLIQPKNGVIIHKLHDFNIEAAKLNEEQTKRDTLQDQIISGSLPVPREEAAYLASIQLCVEEQWPSNKRTQTIRRHLLKGQFGRIRDMCQKIMITPWEVDQNLYCTPPRFPSEAHARVGPFKSHPVVEDSSHPSRLPTLLRCITNTEGLSEEIQAQCLPVDLRGDRRTIKLIKERKRKLFHSQVYDNEFAMKKLYCQTAKKLAAFGCKVFQVKELLHGRTLRKTLRLLCLSSGSLSLLDANSKLVLKRQHASTLQQWRVGGGINKHQLLLEFRGTKWQLIAPSYNALKSISMTLWEIMQNSASNSIQKSLNQSMPRSPTDQLCKSSQSQ